MQWLLIAVSIILGLLAACARVTPPPAQSSPEPEASKPVILKTPTSTVKPTSPADAYAFEQNHRLGRGVNLGNALEAPNEGEWGMLLQEEYFKLIKEIGFNSVRIPIRWSAHAEAEPPFTIDALFFERVDWAVDQALKNELAAVINIHHYEEIMENPIWQKDRFLAIWKQIAEHYQNAPESVYFELLNEPYGTLANTSWNDLATEAIAIIRQSNPRRTVIVGPGNWNGIDMLSILFLPVEDRNLIVTVHYYLPFQFTHQGAEWVDGSDPWLGTTWGESQAQKHLIDNDLDKASKWSAQQGRPIFLGEFGAYSKADMFSRQRWTAYVARAAEQRGFSWAYWEFGAVFGVYDREAQAWVEPIRQALLP